MNLETEHILIAVLVFLWFDILIVLRTLMNKSALAISAERRRGELSQLAHLFETEPSEDKRKVRRLFDNYLRLKQSIDLPEGERKRILSLARADSMESILERRITYRSRYDRMEASLGLALIGGEKSRLALEAALAKEKDAPSRLYMANALADIGDPRSLPALTESLIGSHRWYRDKVNMLIASFGKDAELYLHGLFSRAESEIVELIVDASTELFSAEMRDYLVDLVILGQERMGRLSAASRDYKERSCYYCVHGRRILDGGKRSCPYKEDVDPAYHCSRWKLDVTAQGPAGNFHRIMVKAAESLARHYSSILNNPRYLDHSDPAIRNIAVRSLGSGNEESAVRELIGLLGDEGAALSARLGLAEILENHPRFIPLVADSFNGETEVLKRRHLADVLAGRIEYFASKLGGREGRKAGELMRELLRMGRSSEILELMKTSKDPALDEELVHILREEIPGNPALAAECSTYLPDRFLQPCGLERILPVQKRREEKLDRKMVRSLYVILALALGFFPMLYLLRYSDKVRFVPIIEQLKTFVVDFNYDFAWYSIAVNLVYLVLLGLSALQVRKSTRLWNLKTMSFLFKPRILPGVSIIAPAYNEEKTIIESVNSLLNIKYPDHELVVVNDGSKDSTLDTLIAYYGMKRKDYYFEARLKTAKVRGIYKSPLHPRLVVVDKENGGKADSLNAGINVASREYFCGIDADSLLEPDALLKVAALTLDYGVETPAMGGNVFPINGCDVDRGHLTKIALPKTPLPRLQTIEYLRAFMCGRLGWARVNSLLIISGAFGLFRKERIVGIGGYLTSNERYARDTVGEDMELVVRISRLMREKKQKYRIGYAYNANCWTEVPESMKVLKRQRDRWHRGLIDIMFFHRKIIFNPSYGKMGLLGMPYFLIFEMIGPLFEIQGYLMVALAAVFGLISTRLAILLFFSSILMGVFISMSSVLIAERQLSYFNYRDTLKMLAISVLENFGPRQVFSMWRVLGFFSAMQKPKGWGKMERKGFASPSPSPAAPGPIEPKSAAGGGR